MVASKDFQRDLGQHRHGIWLYLRYLGCSRGDADDLTQETFKAALESQIHDIDERAVSSYLRTIARRQFLKWVKGRTRFSSEVDLELADAVWQEFDLLDDKAVLVERLAGCVAKLSARARRAIKMRYGNTTSRKRIGLSLGISESGVAMLLQRSLRALRACMKKAQDSDT